MIDISDSPNSYLAFELTTVSRVELLRRFPPKFSRVIAHHSTMTFNPTKEKIELLKSLFDQRVTCVGYAHGDGVECAAVEIGRESTRLDGSFYHVTISVEPPRKPVDSNGLKSKIEPIEKPFELHGVFKLIPKT